MKRIWIDSFGINVKSALCNLQSAILLGAMLFALCSSAQAQQGKIYRIGVLASGRAEERLEIKGLRTGLAEAGYVEGQKSSVEYPQR